jgi:cytochrome P450
MGFVLLHETFVVPSRLPGPIGGIQQMRVALGVQSRPTDTIEALHARYGNVVRFGYRPFRYVLLFGAEANKLILTDRVEAFTWREAFAMLEPVDGPTALVMSDGGVHKRRRRLVQPAFHSRRIHGYLDLMVEEIDRTLDTWTSGRQLLAYDELRRSVRRIVVRALFGDELRERADEIGDVLEPALEFVDKTLLQQQLKIDLPWTAWHRCKVARQKTDVIVDAELARRRASTDPGAGDDILAMLLSTVDDDGGPGLSDEEIRDQVVSLIAAGYHTTSGATAWALRALLLEPGVWDKVRAEVDEIAGAGPLTVDGLQSMRYLDGVVHESLRLWPPGFVAGRKCHETIEFDGHTIPARSMVLYSPWVTQRQPELWPEPRAFRPERWEAAPPPYSFVPFGGGYRRCIGFAFATLELKATLARVVQRVQLELLSDDAAPVGTSGLRPKSGVPVRVVARN